MNIRLKERKEQPGKAGRRWISFIANPVCSLQTAKNEASIVLASLDTHEQTNMANRLQQKSIPEVPERSRNAEAEDAACHPLHGRSELATCRDPMQLNNLTVSYIQAKMYREALGILQRAWELLGNANHVGAFQPDFSCLGLLASSLCLDAKTLALSGFERLTVDDCMPKIYSTPADGPQTAVAVPTEDDLLSSPSNNYAIYNRVFLFMEDRGPLSAIRRSKLLPCVLLYNMGIIQTRIAILEGKTVEYVKAYEFMKGALFIIEANLHLLPLVQDLSLLQLALYNNMGFVNSHFMNETEAKIFAGCMLSTFASMDCARLLSREEYVFFYMNLLFLLNRFPSLAPAA